MTVRPAIATSITATALRAERLRSTAPVASIHISRRGVYAEIRDGGYRGANARCEGNCSHANLAATVRIDMLICVNFFYARIIERRGGFIEVPLLAVFAGAIQPSFGVGA